MQVGQRSRARAYRGYSDVVNRRGAKQTPMRLKIITSSNRGSGIVHPACCARSADFRPGGSPGDLSFSQRFVVDSSRLGRQQYASLEYRLQTDRCPRNLSSYQLFTTRAPYTHGPQSGTSLKLSFSHCFRVARSRLNRSQSANSVKLSFSHCFRVGPSRLDQPRSPNSRKLSFSHCFRVGPSRLDQPRSANSQKLSFSHCFRAARSRLDQPRSANSRKLSFSQCFRLAPATDHRPLTTDHQSLATTSEEN